MEITVTVCNICQDTSLPTEVYELSGRARRRKVDLCEKHAKPVETLMDAGVDLTAPKKRAARSGARKGPGGTSGGRGGTRVHTMEEIEALKGK